MTTSQASRIFGIPYNSLLMYVRGKYGKSLKLEQLRKDCISGPPVELLTIGMSGSSGNGGNSKSNKDSNDAGTSNSSNTPGHPRSASSEPNELIPSANPFNPFPPNFYPEFAAGFPGIPLGMLNLLPPDRQPSQGNVGHIDEDCKSDRSKQSMEDDYPAQPLALNRSGDEQTASQNRSSAVINGGTQD